MPKAKTRGNGQGTAYKRGKGWEACVVIGWKLPDDPARAPVPIKRRKSGFRTKKEALDYCATLMKADYNPKQVTLRDLYKEWSTFYAPRVTDTTMKGYYLGYQHFAPLHHLKVSVITAADLQRCMDDCTKGKRTHELMKTTAGLLWKYAIDNGYAEKNVAANLYTGKGQSVQREPITDDELETIRQAIGREPYADYIYALCYLGFRPGEFLRLKKSDLHTDKGIAYLVGGSKTEAGRNRRVVIPQQIESIIRERIAVPETDLLFPMVCHRRNGEFSGYKEMTIGYFSTYVFKPLMKSLGIADGKVPYSARHTYADKLKHAAGDVKDKAALIGHTDYNFTQKHYQSTPLADLKTVVESIG